MQSDPSSSLLSVVLAQRFTNALKKNTAFDDIYLVVERTRSRTPQNMGRAWLGMAIPEVSLIVAPKSLSYKEALFKECKYCQ